MQPTRSRKVTQDHDAGKCCRPHLVHLYIGAANYLLRHERRHICTPYRKLRINIYQLHRHINKRASTILFSIATTGPSFFFGNEPLRHPATSITKVQNPGKWVRGLQVKESRAISVHLLQIPDGIAWSGQFDILKKHWARRNQAVQEKDPDLCSKACKTITY